MKTVSEILLVGSGGCLGSIARFLLSSAIVDKTSEISLPLGTITVNILGCAIIGLLVGISTNSIFPDYNWKLFLLTGVLGGFTTFSAFGLESFLLFKQQEFLWALLNLIGSPIVGTLAVWAGYQITTASTS